MAINFDHLDISTFNQKAYDLVECIRDYTDLPLNTAEERKKVCARASISKKRFLKEANRLGLSLTLTQHDYVGSPRLSHAVFAVLGCVANFRPELFQIVQSANRLEEALAMLERATGKGLEA